MSGTPMSGAPRAAHNGTSRFLLICMLMRWCMAPDCSFEVT